ncbi:MAG: AmmeMemoRadiSam system radical SAM enzyme [Spirochaetes bacterium]|nr:AmmeMemoRadiSam system radical SAM enzyme [Spirochaetota bacterium]
MKDPDALFGRREFLRRGGRALCLTAFGSQLLESCSDTYCQSGAAYYVKPAKMWKKLGDGTVQCLLCPNGCQLDEGERGICRVRKNVRGSLFTVIYSRISAAHVDPIEKKPLFHYLPGSTAFSIATAGCNLSCKFCQNWELSQSNPEDLSAEQITPEDLSRRARASGSRVIAYTYNEPTVQFEYILDSAAAARRAGLRPVIISNGYIRPEAGKMLARSLDAIKIDLKAFTNRFYTDICGGSLRPVLDNLVAIHGTVKWLELVVLVIPTLNDSPGEIRKMAAWVRKNLSGDVPMHFTRFHAMYRIQNLPPTPVSTLERCRQIARDEGIRYSYVGNVPGHRWENTYCHNCGKMIISRSGFFHVQNDVRNGACPHCGAKVPGVWT